MYPQTHFLAGAVITAVLSPRLVIPSKTARNLFLLGSLLPDAPLFLRIGINWVEGVRPLTLNHGLTQTGMEVMHSVPIWLFILATARFVFPSKNATWLALGALMPHIGIDMITHLGEYFPGADYLWPWKLHMSSIFGVVDYVPPAGQLLPRFWEIWVDAALGVWLLIRSVCASSFVQPGSRERLSWNKL